ncbi:MAG: HNH endonuclease [Mycobacteriales bacterium]
MAILSELLAFPHHTTSRGSTVEKPFLVDLAHALEVPAAARLSKYRLLDAVHGLLYDGQPMPTALKSTGSTVTDEALQRLINGVRERGVYKVSLTEGGAAARIAVATSEAPPTSEDVDLGDPFDPLLLEDERKSALRQVMARSGQGAFRTAVLGAYEGRCAITGCDVPEALEAAHIRPYRGKHTNAVANGICLRADLHRLWDTGRLAVDESSHQVLLDADMIGTDYSQWVGEVIALPRKAKHHPSALALEQQRKWAGL